MEEKERFSPRSFYILSYEDDIPTEAKGQLIPARRFRYRPKLSIRTIPAVNGHTGERYWVTVFTYLSLAVLFIFGAFHTISNPAQMLALLPQTVTQPASPTVVITNPYTAKEQPLTYGVQLTFSEPYFFSEVREGFIDAAESFIEIHFAEQVVRYFEDGVLAKQVPIIKTAERGAWGEVPAGLYKVQRTQASHFSVLGQVYLPHYVGFQGNLAIHGTPVYSNDILVPSDFASVSVQLSDEDAKAIATAARADVPIIVHAREFAPDTFLYEPQVPDVAAEQYLVADIGSNTVLASSDLERSAPIASLTKLMTALIAAENLDLGNQVRIGDQTFVQSLVPRLADRETVTLYSLLQLLLIESSNEAADLIADQLGTEAFVALMNERASSLGLTETTFADPSGLSAGNTSSLRDLLRLTQHIYQTRSFILELSADQSLPSSSINNEFGQLSNFNPITDDETFIGGKIGETRAAGQTSITLHRITVKGEERIVAVIILASANRNADVRQLRDYVLERFGGE